MAGVSKPTITEIRVHPRRSVSQERLPKSISLNIKESSSFEPGTSLMIPYIIDIIAATLLWLMMKKKPIAVRKPPHT